MRKILFYTILCFSLACGVEDGGSIGETSNSGTLSGSYANLLSVSGYLYAINDDELITYDLIKPDQPEEVDRQTLGFGVESLFHRSGVLFIGSRESMFIYTILENGIPVQKSKTDYGVNFDFTPCDPVVANDTLAIASLSSRLTGICGFITFNELRFFDIVDIENPEMINVVEMDEPKGMAIDGEHLFVCEATTGLKIFNIQNALSPELIFHYPDISTFDVIPTGNLLLVVGPTELFEFDYSNIHNVQLLGRFDL